jgi:hypothetical protein
MSESTYPTLNPAQQRVIESVHRGFLYQHLYATACLLIAESQDFERVVVEADEDIEVLRKSAHAYIQVKTRSKPLIPTDLDGAMQRFEQLRSEHAKGIRRKIPAFFFVANRPPGPALAAKLNSDQWPEDVVVVWPGMEGSEFHDFLPPAWKDVAGAAEWCIEQADKIRFRKTSADTLVWKLAATVMLAASGGKPFENHTFTLDDLPQIFEQVVAGLQVFPPAPPNYQPQIDEPSIRSEKHVRMIVGFSGAGKTAWAAYAAQHSESLCIYYDVGDEPSPAVPTALSNEIAAAFSTLAPDKPLCEIIPASASANNALGCLSRYAGQHELEPVVVIDNAHRVSASVLRAMIEVAPLLRFVLLCHPEESIKELETLLGVTRESLQGWNDDTVAAAIGDFGVYGSPEVVKRLRIMTAGMPLYVTSAAKVAVSSYQSNVGALCDAIDNQTHTASTAQEIILTKLFDALTPIERGAVAVISYSNVGLSQDEIRILMKETFDFSTTQCSLLIRELRPQGILLSIGGALFAIHDAFRIIGKREFDLLTNTMRISALQTFIRILSTSLSQSRDTKRLSMLIRAFASLGNFTALVELAGEEMFHELGIDDGVWKILENAIASKSLPPKQQFYALDGLVFRYLKTGQTTRIPSLLEEMEMILGTGEWGSVDKMSFLSKRMSWQTEVGDVTGVSESLASISRIIPDDPVFHRILRYNSAVALWKLGQLKKVDVILRELVTDYMVALGIKGNQIFGRTTKDIRQIISKNPDCLADAKRLADTLEFHARTLSSLGQPPFFVRIQSMKFYEIVGAYDSLVRVGMDVVDDHLTLGDNQGAKEFAEKFVMPVVEELDLPLQDIFVRSQYAVILARCGDHEEAETILRRLRPYYGGLDEESQEGLRLNEHLVLQAKTKTTHTPSAPVRPVRPNDPCPCGSGIRFRSCHGR